MQSLVVRVCSLDLLPHLLLSVVFICIRSCKTTCSKKRFYRYDLLSVSDFFLEDFCVCVSAKGRYRQLHNGIAQELRDDSMYPYYLMCTRQINAGFFS